MGIVIRRGAMRDASSSVYRTKGILLDVTHADSQAQVHLRGGSATIDGSAAQASEARKRRHYARPGHVSFDERSFKLTTFAMESFGRLGEEGYKFINEIATHAAGGRNGVNMNRRGIIKERILQVVSVATQVAGCTGTSSPSEDVNRLQGVNPQTNQDILSPVMRRKDATWCVTCSCVV